MKSEGERGLPTSWSIVGRWTAGAGDTPSPSETDEVTNVGA